MKDYLAVTPSSDGLSEDTREAIETLGEMMKTLLDGGYKLDELDDDIAEMLNDQRKLVTLGVAKDLNIEVDSLQLEGAIFKVIGEGGMELPNSLSAIISAAIKSNPVAAAQAMSSMLKSADKLSVGTFGEVALRYTSLVEETAGSGEVDDTSPLYIESTIESIVGCGFDEGVELLVACAPDRDEAEDVSPALVVRHGGQRYVRWLAIGTSPDELIMFDFFLPEGEEPTSVGDLEEWMEAHDKVLAEQQRELKKGLIKVLHEVLDELEQENP